MIVESTLIVESSLLVIAICASIVASLAMRGKLTGPSGPKGERGERGRDAVHHTAATEASYRPVYRVVRKSNDGWIAGEFVRHGSKAYQEALDTPGIALSCGNGEIELGRQE